MAGLIEACRPSITGALGALAFVLAQLEDDYYTAHHGGSMVIRLGYAAAFIVCIAAIVALWARSGDR